MRLVATIPARNESWCLEASLTSLCQWVDEIVVLDHASTDGTADIARKFGAHVLYVADPVWRESRYRQLLLDKARELGATHVATVDADEILTANAVPPIRAEIEKLGPDEALCVPWLMLWGSLKQHRANDKSVWSRATAPVAFAVGTDYANGVYDIHERVPHGLRRREIWPARDMGLMHLQHVSRRRLIAKQNLYKLNERLRWGKSEDDIERQYGKTTDETGMNLEPVPAEWGVPDVDADAEPWQEAELNRLCQFSMMTTDGITRSSWAR